MMNLTQQKSSTRLNWLTSLTPEEMNSLSIIRAIRLVRNIKKITGNEILLREKGFLLNLVDESVKIQSQELNSTLQELIIALLKLFDSKQALKDFDEISQADANMVLQQLTLHSKVTNQASTAQVVSLTDSNKISLKEVKTILVVDDDVDLLPLMGAILSTLGFQTILAKDGNEALDILAKGSNPDVLLTDIEMPTIGGFKLAGEVKKLRPEIGVLYMSSYHEYASDSVMKNADVNAKLLKKPFDVPLLSEAILEIFEAA